MVMLLNIYIYICNIMCRAWQFARATMTGDFFYTAPIKNGDDLDESHVMRIPREIGTRNIYSGCQNYRTEPGVQKYGKIPYLCTPPGSDSARSREI